MSKSLSPSGGVVNAWSPLTPGLPIPLSIPNMGRVLEGWEARRGGTLHLG
jgi:hypothetical protein